jgi:peptidyl-prolyl cis-trans isomerase D
MTMLDRMRRHKGWLKWSLALVVLAFVVLYFPEFVGPTQTLRPSGDRIATIDSRSVTVADFRRRYMAQIQAYRSSYGGNLTDELLQQMQVPQQVLQQMIQEKAEIAEAERHGITVSDAEVRAQIVAIPGLQENGQFIGRAALPPAAAAADAADVDGRVRAVGAREPDARQVPRGAHRVDVGDRRRARA